MKIILSIVEHSDHLLMISFACTVILLEKTKQKFFKYVSTGRKQEIF